LFVIASGIVWEEVRIFAVDVYEFLLGGWGCRELGWISGGVFYVLGD
jgi:hypothetical protein